MTTKFQAYPKYKPSGVDWLGDIPVGWDVRVFKGLFKPSNERVGDDPSVELPLSVSGYRGVEPRNIASMEGQMPSDDVAEYRVVRKGQLAVNTMWLNYAGLGVSEYEGYVSPAYRSYDIRPSINPRYAHHLLRSPLYVQKYTSLLYGVRPNSLQVKTYDFERIEILLPPLDTQKRIADFLDEKTEIIDALIAKKERLIELLREKRSALITRAVTKGLDPRAKFKPSGVDWLGDIPEGWQLKKLKFIASMRSGESITSDLIQPEGNFPVYGGNGLRGYTDAYTHKGDFVLIGRQGALCGNINYASGRFWASEHAVVVSSLQQIIIVWLGEMLRVMNLNQHSVSAAQPGLAIDKIKELLIPFPTFSDQQAIALFLGRETTKIEEPVKKLEMQIEKLKEYRSSLIYSAVTGKVKV